MRFNHDMEWGTSRAVRLPKALCDELGKSIGSPITMEFCSDDGGSFVVLRPVQTERGDIIEVHGLRQVMGIIRGMYGLR